MAEITPFVNRFNRDVAPTTPAEYLGPNRNRTNAVAQGWRRFLWGKKTDHAPGQDYQTKSGSRNAFGDTWLGRMLRRRNRPSPYPYDGLEGKTTEDLQQYMAMAQFAIHLALMRDARGKQPIATYKRQLNNLNNRWHHIAP